MLWNERRRRRVEYSRKHFGSGFVLTVAVVVAWSVQPWLQWVQRALDLRLRVAQETEGNAAAAVWEDCVRTVGRDGAGSGIIINFQRLSVHPHPMQWGVLYVCSMVWNGMMCCCRRRVVDE